MLHRRTVRGHAGTRRRRRTDGLCGQRARASEVRARTGRNAAADRALRRARGRSWRAGASRGRLAQIAGRRLRCSGCRRYGRPHQHRTAGRCGGRLTGSRILDAQTNRRRHYTARWRRNGGTRRNRWLRCWCLRDGFGGGLRRLCRNLWFLGHGGRRGRRRRCWRGLGNGLRRRLLRGWLRRLWFDGRGGRRRRHEHRLGGRSWRGDGLWRRRCWLR